jgi:F-type H+-transporting ATPase subunit b
VHTVSVSFDGAGVVLVHTSGHALAGPFVTAQDSTEAPDPGPSPIAPEPKELLWSLGAFLVLLVAMRYYLVPKVKKGMDARYGKTRTELETAEAMREAARAEVEAYEAQLAAVRGEASARIDAARDVLDGERADRLAEANEAIASRRSTAATEAEAARLAASGSIQDAAVAVASRVVELSTGRRPDEAAVRRAVVDLSSAGARS